VLLAGLLTHTQSLEVLDISYNKLGGPLPEAFAAMGSLRELLLDVNQLSGTLPEVRFER
jgi:hypothetical protein